MNNYSATGNMAFVNGKQLPLRQDIANHSPDGVAWGYEGSGPAQFALAVMVQEFGEDLSCHPVNYQECKRRFIAKLRGSHVAFNSNDVLIAIGMVKLSPKTIKH